MSLYNVDWINDFKPKTIDEILSHKSIISTLKKCVEQKYLPHLLFYGPPGTGKTTAITRCARELYGDMYDIMVLEINASEERGIDMVRSKIKYFATAKINFTNVVSFKLIILDEADSLTLDAQGILRLVIEKYTSNVRFCLICNYIKNINPAILSRCVLLKFKYIKPIHIVKKIDDVINKLNIKIEQNAYNLLIKLSKGDIRKLLHILQMVSFFASSCNNTISEKTVCDCLGYPDNQLINNIYKILNDKKILLKEKIIKITEILSNESINLQEVITEIADKIINEVKLNNLKKIKDISKILDSLSKLENALSAGGAHNILIPAFVSVFVCYNLE